MSDYEWSDMESLVIAILNAEKDVAKLKAFVARGHEAGQIVTHAYSYAGSDVATSSAHGGRMLQIFSRTEARIDEISVYLRGAKTSLKAAIATLDEIRVKRQEIARKGKLNV